MDTELEVCIISKKFKGNDVTFAIHRHYKDVIHVTGVKSHSHLKTFIEYLEETYKVKIEETIIDNQFISHKDNKAEDLRKIYANFRHNNKYIVIFNRNCLHG